MANYESTEFALAYTTKSKLGPESKDGKLRRLVSSYTAPAGIVAGSTISFAKLPANAVISNASISFSIATASLTLDVGWLAGSEALEAAVVDGIFDAVTGNATTSSNMNKDAASVEAGLDKKFLEEVEISALTAGATIATGAIIRLELEYILE